MPGEWQLTARVENPHTIIRIVISRREEEGRFGEAQPLGQVEHLLFAEIVCTMDHAERVAAHRAGTEYIY